MAIEYKIKYYNTSTFIVYFNTKKKTITLKSGLISIVVMYYLYFHHLFLNQNVFRFFIKYCDVRLYSLLSSKSISLDAVNLQHVNLVSAVNDVFVRILLLS
jgi:hypothetical protein